MSDDQGYGQGRSMKQMQRQMVSAYPVAIIGIVLLIGFAVYEMGNRVLHGKPPINSLQRLLDWMF